jgi:hypothetical protein
MSIPEVPMSTTSENEVDYCNDEQIHVDEAWNQIGSRFSKYSENNFSYEGYRFRYDEDGKLSAIVSPTHYSLENFEDGGYKILYPNSFGFDYNILDTNGNGLFDTRQAVTPYLLRWMLGETLFDDRIEDTTPCIDNRPENLPVNTIQNLIKYFVHLRNQ